MTLVEDHFAYSRNGFILLGHEGIEATSIKRVNVIHRDGTSSKEVFFAAEGLSLHIASVWVDY